jgi:hypothetical protein
LKASPFLREAAFQENEMRWRRTKLVSLVVVKGALARYRAIASASLSSRKWLYAMTRSHFGFSGTAVTRQEALYFPSL